MERKMRVFTKKEMKDKSINQIRDKGYEKKDGDNPKPSDVVRPKIPKLPPEPKK